ncbi:MAG TPA: glycogen debranching N-terminal domain-containing protein [Ktedonobacteraceae bacterium]|nr:glycogen debranching N-terminal domain-containing protein [Ktedonobacteraceae bacterium]
MADATPETQAAGRRRSKSPGTVTELVKGLGNTSVKKIRLKYNEAFIVSDVRGDFAQAEREMGLYRQATRYLRTCNLFLEGYALEPLSHTIAENGSSCQVNLTNPRLTIEGTVIEPNTILVRRCLELHSQALLQTIDVSSFHFTPLTFELSLKVEADFYDIFEVRGWPREKRGHLYAPEESKDGLTFKYRGLDEVERATSLTFTPAPDRVDSEGVAWDLLLSKDQAVKINVAIRTDESGGQRFANGPVANNANEVLAPALLLDRPLPEVHTGNMDFDKLLKRGIDDLLMLCTSTPQGIYPYGGIPTYVCPFGRDGLIASLQFLPWFPEVARGTIAFLAAHQGDKVDLYTEEEPGKILHEFRFGELASCGEIPFAPYYGSIDATPLFLITCEAYLRWTNDLALLEQLWPNIEAAARWMTEYGDKDKDTFLEYQSTSDRGLISQGWKDSSGETISHRDGSIAAPPIALCEVQAYAYAAYRAVSYLADRLGKSEEAAYWSGVAEKLQANFLRSFWWEEEHVFYLALDGSKQPCAIVTSNAGQCLWSGIVPDALAQKMITRLSCEDMDSGWGIRTLSEHAARYNPMSYHNGTVWPHDTAIVGAGFARYGAKARAGRLLENLIQVGQYYEGARLPELFCGFARNYQQEPVPYPVACEPQAWAAGAPFLLLNALLGFEPDAEHHRLTLRHPLLPEWLQKLEVRGVRLGKQQVNLLVEHSDDGTAVILSGETGGTGVKLHVEH